jgi:two-component system chemotaxis response regulator CheB
MPLNAMRNMQVDYCVPAAGVAALLTELASTEASSSENGERAMSDETRDLVDPKELLKDPPPNERQIALSCPECGGSLYEEKSGDMAHFRCHVGHSFSPETLSETHKEALERALWAAVRTLNERVTMHRQFLRRERNAGEDLLFKRFEESVAAAERDVRLLREIIARV